MSQSKLAQAIINETIPEEDSAPGDFVAAVRDLEGTPEDVAIDLGQELADKASLSVVSNVVSLTKTDTYLEEVPNRDEETDDIPGLIASITPTSGSSKILISGKIDVSTENGGVVTMRLLADGSYIARGDSAGSRARVHGTTDVMENRVFSIPFCFLHEPSTTSEVSYSIRLTSASLNPNEIVVNRTYLDENEGFRQRSVSTITVQEIPNG